MHDTFIYGKTYYGDNTINSLSVLYAPGSTAKNEYRNGQGMVTQDWSGSYIGYDTQGRVNYYSTTAPSSTSTAEWTYDNQGNLLTSPNQSDTQCYNSMGELVSQYSSACPQSPCSSSNPVGVNSYSYDAFGNTASYGFLWNGQCESSIYSFNTLGQMRSFNAFYTGWNYYYSANGNLIHEEEGTNTVNTLTWNQSTSPNQILSDSTWDYIYGPEGSPVEAFKKGVSNSQIYMIASDNQTEVMGINTSNSAAFINNYGPWGNQTSPTSSEPNIGYDGGFYDSGSQNWLFTNRLYNQNTGLFYSPDPSVIQQNQPVTFAGAIPTNQDTSDLYAFSYNDPVNLSDITGLGPSGNPCDREYVLNSGMNRYNSDGNLIKNDLTRADLEYSKHMNPGGFLDKVTGNSGVLNQAGQKLLEEILTNPETRTARITGGGFNGGIFYIEPNGFGVAVNVSGQFVYFGYFDKYPSQNSGCG